MFFFFVIPFPNKTRILYNSAARIQIYCAMQRKNNIIILLYYNIYRQRRIICVCRIRAYTKSAYPRITTPRQLLSPRVVTRAFICVYAVSLANLFLFRFANCIIPGHIYGNIIHNEKLSPKVEELCSLGLYIFLYTQNYIECVYIRV